MILETFISVCISENELFVYWVILYTFCLLVIFFIKSTFLKSILGIPSVCQTVWIQNRPQVLLGRTLVQNVCEGHQQTALVGKELKPRSIFFNIFCDLRNTILS